METVLNHRVTHQNVLGHLLLILFLERKNIMKMMQWYIVHRNCTKIMNTLKCKTLGGILCIIICIVMHRNSTYRQNAMCESRDFDITVYIYLAYRLDNKVAS